MIGITVVAHSTNPEGNTIFLESIPSEFGDNGTLQFEIAREELSMFRGYEIWGEEGTVVTVTDTEEPFFGSIYNDENAIEYQDSADGCTSSTPSLTCLGQLKVPYTMGDGDITFHFSGEGTVRIVELPLTSITPIYGCCCLFFPLLLLSSILPQDLGMTYETAESIALISLIIGLVAIPFLPLAPIESNLESIPGHDWIMQWECESVKSECWLEDGISDSYQYRFGLAQLFLFGLAIVLVALGLFTFANHDDWNWVYGIVGGAGFLGCTCMWFWGTIALGIGEIWVGNPYWIGTIVLIGGSFGVLVYPSSSSTVTPPPPPVHNATEMCHAVTLKKELCKNRKMANSDFCSLHRCEVHIPGQGRCPNEKSVDMSGTRSSKCAEHLQQQPYVKYEAQQPKNEPSPIPWKGQERRKSPAPAPAPTPAPAPVPAPTPAPINPVELRLLSIHHPRRNELAECSHCSTLVPRNSIKCSNCGVRFIQQKQNQIRQPNPIPDSSHVATTPFIPKTSTKDLDLDLDTSTLSIPTSLSKQELARGGMKIVYLRNEPDGSTVVYKLASDHNPGMSLQIANEKLQFEAELMEKIGLHPHIPELIEYGKTTVEGTSDVGYLVEEYIPGDTLADTMRHVAKAGTRVPLHRAVQWVISLCEPLMYCASMPEPVYHRDIKPENIIVHETRGPIIIDWGVAKVDTGSAHTTQVFSSGAWTAPERRTGVTGSFTDVYSLGKILSCLVLGEEDARNVIDSEDLIDFINAGASRELAQCIVDSCKSRPERRIPTVRELHTRLVLESVSTDTLRL